RVESVLRVAVMTCAQVLRRSNPQQEELSAMRRLSRTATNDRMTEVSEPVDATSVWDIARTLVQQRGTDAPTVAARQARELLAAGEIERRLTWMRVMVASKALLGNETAQADGRHESQQKA